MNPRYAILLDGGFVTKAISKNTKAPATLQDIQQLCQTITANPILAGSDLLRIYYYDAPPASGTITNPIDGTVVNLGNSAVHQRNTQLLDQLELLPNFALRKGETVVRGWRIGQKALKNMMKTPRLPVAGDLVPSIEQKGVDLRIGLDISRLALRDMVRTIVVVTGDSDMVPAFKFARREGVRMILHHLGMPVRRELMAHSDIII
ncbi:MAG: NYN domain-containing protein [Gallionella sp.]